MVLSVRDLVRQIPAEWQENVKHRRTLGYAAFLEQIRDPERTGRLATWFWGVQEVPDILDRWGGELDPSRVHVVTVPPPGAPTTLLWERFATPSGSTGIPLDLQAERVNPSLGVPETALLRQINRPPTSVVEPAHYRPLVRELLAHQTLSQRTGSPRLSLPPDVRTWADELSRRWVAELRERGYDVVGDLDELLPAPATDAVRRPDRPSARQVNGAAVEAIRALLVEAARLREAEADLRARARRGPPGAGAGLPATVLPRPREAGPLRGGEGLGPPADVGLPPGAGQELAVGVAADLPGREAVDRRGRPARRRPGPGARWWWPAACPPPG